MQKKKKIRKLHLPKETMLILDGDEAAKAAAGLSALTCACTRYYPYQTC